MSKREIFKRAWAIRKIKAYEMGCKVSEVSMSECLKMVYAGVKLANTILSVTVGKKEIMVKYGRYGINVDGNIYGDVRTRRLMSSASKNVLNFMCDKTVGCKTMRNGDYFYSRAIYYNNIIEI